jgi:hypothetical protein
MYSSSPLSTADRRQRAILRIGAVYDAGFGIPLLLVPVMICNALALPIPGPGMIWLRLDGIFLIVVGAIYWVMSQDPARYLGIMTVILTGKTVSVVFYLLYVFARHESRTFLLFAALDVVMFALHVWALGPGGFARVRAALRPAEIATT